MKKSNKKLIDHTFILQPDYKVISSQNDQVEEGYQFGFFIMSVDCTKELGEFLQESLQKAVDVAIKNYKKE